MSVREILKFPDKRLRKVAKPVQKFDDYLDILINDMFETMYHSDGIGLAATQIDVHLRVIVIDIKDVEKLYLINPEITQTSGTMESKEGCLSVPYLIDYVPRAEKISLKSYNRQGKPKLIEATGLLAVCIQHEIDHLDGKLFVDYLSSLKRSRLKKKINKDATLAS
ncbi:MAG: peptide deformylase [Methylococcaceae bacterium TMED69]|nr:MAG: peptide deformylase [Methylococcaceae bacterium TMED69]|tara:strand:+ start:95 stop:592 length:498 start_codon:yes stop_codon:yes gene_type:complete